jgi:hypothetical protein
MKIQFTVGLFSRLKGRLGGSIYYVHRGTTQAARAPYIDRGPSPAQQAQRDLFKKVDQTFISLDAEERAAWRHAATRRKKFSNYAYFMSINLRRAKAGQEILRLPI